MPPPRQFERDLAPLLDSYRTCLEALDAEAQARTHRPFAALDPHAQDALLAAVEKGQTVTSWPVDPALFFRILVDHAMEGYYGDPANGGNRDGIAWRMIGFEVRG